MLPLTQNMREYLLEIKKRQEGDKKLLGNGYMDRLGQVMDRMLF